VMAGFEARSGVLAELSARLFGSAEAAEGMAAFREKRRPAWAVGSARNESSGRLAE
jgi:enoyl-CoA hydratase